MNMKKITFLLSMVLISAVSTAQVVLEDFSSVTVNAGGGAAGDFGGFGGVAPSLTTDGGDDVGQTINDAAGEPWQGAYVTVDTNFMDLTTTKTVSVDVYNNDGNTFYLLGQVELGQAGAPTSQALLSHDGMGWQTLTFDFNTPANGSPVANGEYGQFTIYTSVNSAGGFVGDAGDPMNNAVDITLWIDDVTAVAGNPVTPPASVDFPIDFESMSTSDLIGFDGCAATVEAVASPQDTGNTSAQLMKLVRNGGQVWAGVAIDVDSNVDLSTKPYITFEMWTNAPVSTPVITKTEESGNGGNTTGDVAGATTAQNAWHTLTYDLSSGSMLMNQNRVVIIPNLGTLGDGSLEYFVDNVQNVSTLSDGGDLSLENKVSVFPNPTKSDWTVLTSKAIIRIDVYDVLGKQVITLEPNSTRALIDASSLNKGVYFARIEGESSSKTIKLVRE